MSNIEFFSFRHWEMCATLVPARGTGIESVSEAISDQIKAQYRQSKRQPGKGAGPPCRAKIVAAGNDHCSPLRARRLGAQADETKRGNGQHGKADVHA